MEAPVEQHDSERDVDKEDLVEQAKNAAEDHDARPQAERDGEEKDDGQRST
jgi:hypothetical protein